MHLVAALYECSDNIVALFNLHTLKVWVTHFIFSKRGNLFNWWK